MALEKYAERGGRLSLEKAYVDVVYIWLPDDIVEYLFHHRPSQVAVDANRDGATDGLLGRGGIDPRLQLNGPYLEAYHP